MDNVTNIEGENKVSKLRSVFWFLVAILVPVAVGLISAFITRNNMNVFDEINKPPLTPARMVFPIAWTILYILMGLSSYLAFTAPISMGTKITLMIPYVLQLIFNFMWSIIFFNAGLYAVALGCLIILGILVIMTMIYFRRASILSSILLIPYILWLCFACYLNIAIVILN